MFFELKCFFARLQKRFGDGAAIVLFVFLIRCFFLPRLQERFGDGTAVVIFINIFSCARLQKRFGDGAVIELSVDDGMLHIAARDAIICQKGLFLKVNLNVHDASVQDASVYPLVQRRISRFLFFSRALCFPLPVVCVLLSRALV